ncbi:MAG: hypothetical protein U0736_21585 [Gemmataceae bacterium]
MIPHRLYVAAVGQGIFRSLDHGDTFRRAVDGMPFVECDVRALVVDPHRPEVLYAGNEEGLFVTRDGADTWERVPGPLDGRQIWTIHLSATRPGRLLVGTCPAAVFRSDDGGASWQQATADMTADCPRIRHTRVTCFAADPDDPDRLWAGVEIDGVHHSSDGGRTWARIGTGLSSPDIHALAVVPAAGGPKRLLATTNRDLNSSEDGGQTWRPFGLARQLPWIYTRGLAQLCGTPANVLMGAGEGPPGWEGTICRSYDGGRTWGEACLHARTNSTVWCFAVHPAEPDLVYAASVSGEVYRSFNAGDTWRKLPREFGEIRGLAWAPH